MYSLAYLQDSFPSLAGVFAYYFILAKVGINLVYMLENALIVHAFGYITSYIYRYILANSIANDGWCMMATSNRLAICFRTLR